MKNFLGKKYVQIGITAFCVIAASMLFYFGSSNIICSMAGYPFYGAQCGLSDL